MPRNNAWQLSAGQGSPLAAMLCLLRCVKPAYFLPMACLAPPPSLRAYAGISRRVFVSMLAVRLRSLPFSRREHAKNKPLGVQKPIWADNHFVWKSSLSPLHDSVGLDSGNLSKLDGPVCLSTYSDKNCTSLVSLLCYLICPPAIIRAVWAIIVDAVYAVSIRPRTHILDEVLEAVPPIANINAPTPVVVKLLEFLVKAASSNTLPNMVKRVWILKRHVGNSFAVFNIARTAAQWKRS